MSSRDCFVTHPSTAIGSYEHARQIKDKQDEHCSKAFADEWKGLGEFPEDLQWEALVDILRGKVKVNITLGTEVGLSVTKPFFRFKRIAMKL